MFDAPASRYEIEKAGFALVNERNLPTTEPPLELSAGKDLLDMHRENCQTFLYWHPHAGYVYYTPPFIDLE